VAMIRLERKLNDSSMRCSIILQVHDELVLEVPEDEVERVIPLIRWAMELDQPLRVPLEVDVHTGASWMET
jgi:DNA polymerase-1